MDRWFTQKCINFLDRFEHQRDSAKKVHGNAVESLIERLLGLFEPEVSDRLGSARIIEMMCQWEISYALDDGDCRETFGASETPLSVAVQEMLADALPNVVLPALQGV